MTRTLITGGAGFIGSHLARFCVRRGETVHVAVRPGTSLHRIDDLGADVAVHVLDISDAAAVARCLDTAKPDQVFHLAVETGKRTETQAGAVLDATRTDISNLMTLIKAMTEMPRPPRVLVRTGSIAEYGALPPPFREGQQEAPVNAYATALLAGTRCLETLRASLPFAAVTARLALVYGPGQSEAFLVPALIRYCLDRARFEVARPEDRRDLLYVEDAAEGLWQLALRPSHHQPVINIATGVAPTMREVAMRVIEATDASRALIRFGNCADAVELRLATELARDTIGWTATTPFAEGIALTVAQMRQKGRMAA